MPIIFGQYKSSGVIEKFRLRYFHGSVSFSALYTLLAHDFIKAKNVSCSVVFEQRVKDVPIRLDFLLPTRHMTRIDVGLAPIYLKL